MGGSALVHRGPSSPAIPVSAAGLYVRPHLSAPPAQPPPVREDLRTLYRARAHWFSLVARERAQRRKQRARKKAVLLTEAQKAVAFAYAQLGCPYVWGGTGPCGAGYDCSGLVQAAWAYAGVAIPRTSEEQWALLTPVPASQVQPGDLLIFDGGGHVGIYVGGGWLIDAPQPGENVERIRWSGWYQDFFVGAVRP